MTDRPRIEPGPNGTSVDECESIPLPKAPKQVLVVSDLHLAAGRDPRTGKINRRENFLADAEFQSFLEYHSPEKVDGASLLVLNGDIFDFLRIVRVPRTTEDFAYWSRELAALGEHRDPQQLASEVVKKERIFGLRTNDYKTVWKVLQIAGGHRRFFQALGLWVTRGGHVLIVKGNHDLELHWPLVQRGIRQEIARQCSDSAADRQVHFCDGCARIGNIHFEHGHRFESVTAVKGDRPTMPNGQEILLPIGSFVNRYIINKLEDLEPFLDNIKPVTDLLWALVRRHPIKSAGILLNAIPFLQKSLKPYYFRESIGFAVLLVSLVIPIITVILILSYILGALDVLFFPSIKEAIDAVTGSQVTRQVLSVAGLAAPWLIGLVRDLLPKRKPKHGEDDYGEGMHGVLTEWNPGGRRIYGVLGHTHTMDVQDLGEIDGARVIYLNSGSWAPTWRKDRPDLTGKIIHSFIRFDLADAEYEGRSLEWSDEREKPVEATIIARRFSH